MKDLNQSSRDERHKSEMIGKERPFKVATTQADIKRQSKSPSTTYALEANFI